MDVAVVRDGGGKERHIVQIQVAHDCCILERVKREKQPQSKQYYLVLLFQPEEKKVAWRCFLTLYSISAIISSKVEKLPLAAQE